MARLIVHPGTGTIIDAEDGTLIVDVPDSPAWDADDDDALVSYAEAHGSSVIPDEQYAVAVGEMFDGIDFHGPFPSFEDAMEWGEGNASRTYWIVKLESTSA